MLIVEDAEEFLDEKELESLTPGDLKEWARRREWFLKVLNETETFSGIEKHQISSMMRRPRSYFASVLDMEGIGGYTTYLHEKHF